MRLGAEGGCRQAALGMTSVLCKVDFRLVAVILQAHPKRLLMTEMRTSTSPEQVEYLTVPSCARVAHCDALCGYLLMRPRASRNSSAWYRASSSALWVPVFFGRSRLAIWLEVVWPQVQPVAPMYMALMSSAV